MLVQPLFCRCLFVAIFSLGAFSFILPENRTYWSIKFDCFRPTHATNNENDQRTCSVTSQVECRMGEERITCITIFYSNSFGRLPAIKWKTRHEIVFLFSLFFPATNTLCQMENSEYLFPELARRAEEKNATRTNFFNIEWNGRSRVPNARAHTHPTVSKFIEKMEIAQSHVFRRSVCVCVWHRSRLVNAIHTDIEQYRLLHNGSY